MKHLAITGMVCLALVALAGCNKAADPQPSASAAAEGDELVIYSPHSDEIRDEFGAGFEDWYFRRTGRRVRVSWPDAGGTSQMLRRLQDKFEAKRFDVDVVFGGGSPTFEEMKSRGLLDPCKLPDDLLAAIPPIVAGQRIYDSDFTWYGAALTNFGLIYNREVIREQHLPPVTTWEAMADPAYFGRIGAGDAAKSGSMRAAYEIILEAYGYDRGMDLLVRMFANSRQIYSGSGEIPRDCAQGIVTVGPCIDFYADRQMHSEGGQDLGYVAPPGLTILNCDPIAILKNAPHRAVAEKFMEYVLSPAGQLLWVLPPGVTDGPKKFALERTPVLPALMTRPDVKARRGDTTDPFSLPPASFYAAAKNKARVAIMPDYLRVAAVENEAPLKRAWRAIIDAGLPPDLVAELTRPVISEDEMLQLARDVWAPVRIPADATPEKATELRQKEELRLRQKTELITEWRNTLYRRYVSLAEKASER
jgi:iron(III) transport system substrate-binding protein